MSKNEYPLIDNYWNQVKTKLIQKEMIFKISHFEHMTKGMAKGIITLSSNSASSILLVFDTIGKNFYQINASILINEIEYNLMNPDFLQKIEPFISDELKFMIEQEEWTLLRTSFFNYYYSRLPVLLKARVDGKCLSKTEIELISRICFLAWEEVTPNYLKKKAFKSYWYEFEKSMKWYVRKQKRDNMVYANDWLWSEIELLFPHFLIDSNTNNFTVEVLNSCFPMFWNTLQSEHHSFIRLSKAVNGFA